MSEKNEVAILGQNDVPKLLQQVKDEIKQIKGGDKEAVSTSGKELPGFGQIVHIETVEELIAARSSVDGREAAFDAAGATMKKEMKFKGKMPKFKEGSLGADAWRTDINLRYKEVAHKAQLDKLQKVQTELEKVLSEEDKLANTLSNITELMAE